MGIGDQNVSMGWKSFRAEGKAPGFWGQFHDRQGPLGSALRDSFDSTPKRLCQNLKLGGFNLSEEWIFLYLPAFTISWLRLTISCSRIRLRNSTKRGISRLGWGASPGLQLIVFDDGGFSDLILWTNSGPKYSTCSTDLMIRNRGSRRHHRVPTNFSATSYIPNHLMTFGWRYSDDR